MQMTEPKRPRKLPGAIAGACLAVLSLTAIGGVHELRAHGTEARRVVALTWPKDRITRVLDVNRSELGVNGSKVAATLKTIGGRSCLFGDLFAFDIDDRYAFDVDEPVDLTVMYAPDLTQPFTVAWDQNAGHGYGVSELVRPEPGAELRQVTIHMDRARFAGQGILGTDVTVGARGGIALCDLLVERSGRTLPSAPVGSLRLEVRDAQTNRAVPARLGLYDTTGRTPLPSDRSLLVHRYADDTRLLWTAPRLVWPNPNRQVFYVDGSYEADVPAGTYRLVASKGPEYRVYEGTIDVRAGETTEAAITLERYIDQPSRGWYSGDDHLHLMRDETEDTAVWGYVTAEDVHVGNLLEMGNIVTTHFRQPAWGKAGRFLLDGHMIASGQEDPRTTQRGHTIHHNLQRPIHLPADRYFAYHEVFEESHRQGGVSGYAHHGRSFNGRRGLVLDVPFDLVDFIEVLQGGRLITDNWYPFLNLGFKVNPSAGSDFPYFGPSLPGVERYYVQLDGPFDPDAWYAAFRAGRVFVTNGPLLDFTINGQGMGSEVRVSRGARLDVSALAQLNPDMDRLGRIELVAHGEVIATVSANGGDRAELDEVLTADESMWLAVRAVGEQAVPEQGPVSRYAALAHSAPIYVIVDDQPFWKTEEVADLVAEQRQILADLMSAPVDPVGDLEAWETLSMLAMQWNRQSTLLRPRVEAADAIYQQILAQATDRTSSARARPRDGLVLLAMLAAGMVVVRYRSTGRRAWTEPHRRWLRRAHQRLSRRFGLRGGPR